MRELMRKPVARVLALAGALAIAAGSIVAACAGSGGEVVVFQNAPGEYTYTVNVAEPADFILYFVNTSGSPVRVKSVHVAGASRQMRLINVAAYNAPRTGSGPATAVGILPAECPGQYVPSPITSVQVPAHSVGPWYGVVTVSFQKPGRYLISKFRVDYATPGGSGWEYLVDPVLMTVQNPPLPGPKPVPASEICGN
jgi:hypothetical protein